MNHEELFIRTAVSGAEGEGAEVRRLFPVAGFMNYDPFVLRDEFSIQPVVDILADTDAHFMACYGKPHHQPIHQHGSFVD